jgi:hypothetical protein
MPRTITALGGLESLAAQIPVSLVRLEISGAEKRMSDVDVTLYLNPSTNAVAMAPGAGLLDFVPYAGLTVPQIDTGDDMPLGEVTLEVSNVAGEWWAILAAGLYREATATIWQGNLVLASGASPYAATFQGAVTMWAGNMTDLRPNRKTATITLEPPDFLRNPIPRRTYSAPGFTTLPVPTSKFLWGGGEVEN